MRAGHETKREIRGYTVHVIQYHMCHCLSSHPPISHTCTLLPSPILHTYTFSHPPTFPQTCTLLPSSHLTHTRSSFLQLVLKNTCPLPIALTDPMIATELELTRLHEEMPAVSSGMGVAIWENVQVLSCDHYFARCCALMRVTLVSGKSNQVGMSHDDHMTVT